MRLNYHNLEMEIVKTNRILRTHHYSSDGQTYIGTHWFIDVFAVYNPKATSFEDGPHQAEDSLPAPTDKAIRRHLAEPHNTLQLIAEDDAPILTSPAAGSPCDIRGGPFPRKCDVMQISGIKTWIVRIVIETWTNEISPEGPVIMSHRWSMTEDVNEDHYATRIIRGEAVFRKDVLITGDANGINYQYADQYRRELLHAPLEGFTRKLRVEQSSDGWRIRYTIVDTQVPHTWPGPITRIEAYHTSGSTFPSIGNALIRGGQQALGGVVDAIGALDMQKPAAWIPHLMGGMGGMINEGIQSKPSFYEHVVARCWGDKSTPRSYMMSWAIGVCWGRLAPRQRRFGKFFPTISDRMTRSLSEKFVEYEAIIQVPPQNQLIAEAAALEPEELKFGSTDATSFKEGGLGDLIDDSAGPRVPWQSPGGRDDGGVRSTALLILTHQLLETNGDNTPQPRMVPSPANNAAVALKALGGDHVNAAANETDANNQNISEIELH